MSRINTNVTSLVSARVLGQNNAALNKTLERLSTGYRINRSSDDAAGLVASENLRSEMASLDAAIGNAQRAESIVSTAEGALAEVSDKLLRLQELVSQVSSEGGTTQDEIDANQIQVDGIIESINRIGSQTSFQGAKLLDGSMGFNTTTGAGDVSDVHVYAAKGVDSASKTLNLAVADGDEATKATAAAAIATAASGGTWRVTGAKGSEVFTFASGATSAMITSAVNAASALTGVYASGSALYSTTYGADQFITVEDLSASAKTEGLAGGVGTANGTDATVTMDGMAVSVSGNKGSIRTSMLDIEFTMSTDLYATAGGTSETITIASGGGAKFQLSPNIGMAGQEVIGINRVSGYDLGASAYGHLSDIMTGQSENLTDDPGTAQEIVDAAIKQVAGIRGRLGSFMSDTVGMTVNSLQVTKENVTAAESAIRDTDFATATADLTRNQILVNAANSVLTLANAAPQGVLNLLR